MKNYTNKGFTLIELLVVIAIIGILSSVVLASLSSARTKAQAVSTKAVLDSLIPNIAVCNGDLSGLNLVAGGPICATNSSLLPTAVQLGSPTGTVTYTVSSTSATVGSQGLTVTLTGHPVAGCTVFNVVETGLLYFPAACK